MKKSIERACLVVGLVLVSSNALGFVVEQDGLGMDVGYTLTGQTSTFTVTADFTGATSSWIGDTMDAFSLQFGGNNGGMVTSFSAITSTNTSGNWTGFQDKVSGTGCSTGTFDAICYTVLPTASGADDATIITNDVYTWSFDVIFANSVDLDSLFSIDHSIKFLSVKLLNNGMWTTGSQLSQSGTFCESGECITVPEPNSLVLFGLGLMGLRFVRRKGF